MKVLEIAKLLANRINQEHYILSLMKRLAYAIQKHEAEKRKEVEAELNKHYRLVDRICDEGVSLNDRLDILDFAIELKNERTDGEKIYNPPLTSTRHSRRSIIAEARKECPDMGDGAMIAEGTWGYWVGASVYVDKETLNNVLTRLPGGAESSTPADAGKVAQC